MRHLFPFIECLPEPVLLVTRDLFVVVANRSFAALVADTPSNLQGKSLLDYADSPPEQLRDYVRACCRGAEQVPGTFRLKNGGFWRLDGSSAAPADGEPRVALLRLRPQHQAVAGFTLLNEKIDELQREVDRRKRAEEHLRSANAQLEQRVHERTRELLAINKDLESFTHAMAHDLRAPLRSMRSFAQVIAESAGDRLTPDEHHQLDKITGAAARMANLLEDLVNYSRVAGADVPLLRVAVPHAISEAREALRSEIERRQAELLVNLEEHYVVANPSLLQNVLQNLLSNAVKFTPPERAPRVRIHSHLSNSRVRIGITDNGIGIPREHCAELFKPFRRLPNAAPFTGTGLGLAIVSRAVEKMGGTVGVDTDTAEGSRFWFELPVATSSTH